MSFKASIILFFIFTCLISFSQEENNALPYFQQEPKYDTAPQFPGGSVAMFKFFTDSIRYPEPEKTKRNEGYVSVKFNVTEEGKINCIQVLNGVPGAPNLAKEAVRLIQLMPDWIPARKNGANIAAEVQISVPFSL
jgi:TonB family protein